MSNSTGSKVLATALIVAIIMGGLGFASGYLIFAIRDAGTESPASTVIVEITSTPEIIDESSSSGSPAETLPPATEPVQRPTIEIPEQTGASFDLFWEAWDIIQQDFYGELPDEEELTHGAIRGATEALDDPYVRRRGFGPLPAGPAPRLGADTDDVLAETGIAPTLVARLMRSGVVTGVQSAARAARAARLGAMLARRSRTGAQPTA